MQACDRLSSLVSRALYFDPDADCWNQNGELFHRVDHVVIRHPLRSIMRYDDNVE